MIFEQCKGVHCEDLGESCPTSIFLQKFVSIQPRTSPVKFEWFGSSPIEPFNLGADAAQGSLGAEAGADLFGAFWNDGGFGSTDAEARARKICQSPLKIEGIHIEFSILEKSCRKKIERPRLARMHAEILAKFGVLVF